MPHRHVHLQVTTMDSNEVGHQDTLSIYFPARVSCNFGKRLNRFLINEYSFHHIKNENESSTNLLPDVTHLVVPDVTGCDTSSSTEGVHPFLNIWSCLLLKIAFNCSCKINIMTCFYHQKYFKPNILALNAWIFTQEQAKQLGNHPESR